MTNVADLELTPHLAGGRSRQKLRTRAALVAAAKELVLRGLSPTVEDAAAAADISRTTAYRYFRNQAELLSAAHPEVQSSSLLPKDAPRSPEKRLDLVVRKITRLIVDSEARYRTMLRLSLENPDAEKPYLRRGRAIGWIEEALAPLEGTLSKSERKRLVLAVRTTVGIEALVWLTDVAGLSRDEAIENMRWAALALLQAATDGSQKRAARASKKR